MFGAILKFDTVFAFLISAANFKQTSTDFFPAATTPTAIAAATSVSEAATAAAAAAANTATDVRNDERAATD